MTIKVGAKKIQRKAPTLAQSATAPQATNRPAREIATPEPDTEDKRPVGRPRKFEGKGKPLNFNVDPEFAIEYKTFAMTAGLTMRELLEKSFKEYKQNHG